MSKEREEAISHVVSSAIYWLDSEPSLYVHYDNIDDSFNSAVEHVKSYHYDLTKHDIECAKRELIGKGYKFKLDMKKRRLSGKHKQKKTDPNWGKSNKGLGVKNRWKKRL